MHRLALALTATALLTACYERKSGVVESSARPATSCTDREKVIPKAAYDKLLKSSKDDRNYDQLPDNELVDRWINTLKLINLFDGELAACVVQADGSRVRYVWSQTGLEYERLKLDRLTKALEPRLAAVKPAETPQPTSPVRYPGASDKVSLIAFLRNELRELRAQGHVRLEFERLSLRGEIPGLAEADVEAAALRHFERGFDQLEPSVLEVLVANVMNYSSPSAKLAFVDEIPALAPVAAYFKSKHGQSLSDVVVVSAPTASIPHTGGGLYPNALGMFIPPGALPITFSIRLPGRELGGGGTGVVEGMLHVKIDGHLALITAAMKQHFRSSKLIVLDTDRISKNVAGAAGFEAVAAHELRHLVDYFACPASGEPWCDQKKIDADFETVKAAARFHEKSNYEAYLADADTRRTRDALMALHLKHRPYEFDEADKWASSSLKTVFDTNYAPTYPYFFSMKEQRGYGEQLAYLKSGGLSDAQAVRTAMVTSTGESIPITMGTTKESVPWPGRPWIARLFSSLLKNAGF